MAFDDVPVNSSTKLDDTLMESVEPFDYSKAEAFNMAYLSGYEAERYNQDVSACAGRAREPWRLCKTSQGTWQHLASTASG